MNLKKKVAVIGAGLSGLATIKELVEEGHEVICFEKNDDIGGVFSNIGCYDSVELTVSNYFMAFSDFMPHKESVRFWKRKEYKDYLDKYAAHFDIIRHIQFNCLVKDIKRLETGFDITIEKDDKSFHTEHFDNLAICSGQFQKANIPNIKGLDTFSGKILHSSKYKNSQLCEEMFRDKKVLCLGMGESAADVVTEVSQIASSTILSLRRYHVFAPKYIGENSNFTIDVLQTRFWHSLPVQEKESIIKGYFSDILSDPKIPEGTPVKFLSKHMLEASEEPGTIVTKNERIFEAVAKGMEVDIGGIEEISGSTVLFKSGRKEKIDSILFCTGFEFNLPFLDSKYKIKNIRDCYLQMFHPHLNNELALIGFIRPHQGGIPLMAELQARYYALVLSGKRILPDNLEELAQKDKKKWENEYYVTPQVFGLVNGARYNEKIAHIIGCKPPMPSPIFSFNKFYIYWFHHIWPCQFRLVGPGARESAKYKWTLAPCIDEDNKTFLQKVLVVYRDFWLNWIKSKFSKNKKRKWRPIFSK
ncbi:MAG: NAD(P)-binding domain-containing protein [Cyanobacteria bacterium P01_G01_bin.39]